MNEVFLSSFAALAAHFQVVLAGGRRCARCGGRGYLALHRSAVVARPVVKTVGKRRSGTVG